MQVRGKGSRTPNDFRDQERNVDPSFRRWDQERLEDGLLRFDLEVNVSQAADPRVLDAVVRGFTEIDKHPRPNLLIKISSFVTLARTSM